MSFAKGHAQQQQPLQAFQRLLKESPADWERCLRAIHGSTMAGVVGWHQLPLEPIMAIMQSNAASAWQPAMQLLSLMRTRHAEAHPHPQHQVPFNTTIICQAALMLDAIRKHDADHAAEHHGRWHAALMVQATARELRVPVPENTMRTFILPHLERELTATLQVTPTSRKHEVLSTAVELERVDLLYRRLHYEAASAYVQSTQPVALGTGSTAQPSVVHDDLTSLIVELQKRCAETSHSDEDIRRIHEARTSLCTAIASNNYLEGVVSAMGRWMPSLFGDWQVVDALMQAASREHSRAVHVDAATWGTALRLMRHPLTGSAASYVDSASAMPQCQQHVMERIVASSYITSHIFCSTLLPDHTDVFDRQVQEATRCFADLAITIYFIVNRLQIQLVGAEADAKAECRQWQDVATTSMASLEDVCSPMCRDILRSAIATPATSEQSAKLHVDGALDDARRLSRSLSDSLQRIRAVVRVHLHAAGLNMSEASGISLRNIERMLIHSAWILESSSKSLHWLAHNLPTFMALDSGADTQHHGLGELLHIVNSLTQSTANVAMRLHCRIGQQPQLSSSAAPDLHFEANDTTTKGSGRQRKGPEKKVLTRRGASRDQLNQQDTPAQTASTDTWLATAIEILALQLTSEHVITPRGHSPAETSAAAEGPLYPQLMSQGMDELGLSIAENKCEVRLMKILVSSMMTASAGPTSQERSAESPHEQQPHPLPSSWSSHLFQRLHSVLCGGDGVALQLVRRLLWLATAKGSHDSKSKSLALRCISETSPPQVQQTSLILSQHRHDLLSSTFMAFVTVSLCGLQRLRIERNDLLALSRSDASIMVGTITSLTNVALSQKWYHINRLMHFAQFTKPVLSFEMTRIALSEPASSSTSGTTDQPTPIQELTSCAARIVDRLLARGPESTGMDRPHWQEALRVVELVTPQVRENVAADLLQKDEQGRLIAIALRHHNGTLSKAASRKLRTALDERLRTDILDKLNHLRRTHQWKEAISIYQDYGLQMIRAGGAYAFAFAAGRYPPFAEQLVSQLEAYGGTCKSVGTAALAAAARLWKDRSNPNFSTVALPASLEGQGDATQPHHQRFDRDTTTAIFRHRAKLCATMALAVLPRPIQGDTLAVVTSRVMELLESDEVTAMTFLQENGVIDEVALREARDSLTSSLNLGLSVKEPYYQFRKTFPGSHPTKETFLIIADRLLNELLVDAKSVASFCASCKLIEDTTHQWLPPIRFALSTTVQTPQLLSAANLIADATSWGWLDELVPLVSKHLLQVPGSVVNSGSSSTEHHVGYDFVTACWCSILANTTAFPRSRVVAMLPSICAVLFAIKVRSIAPYALVANPLDAYGNKWESVKAMMPHYAAHCVTEFIKLQMRPLWLGLLPDIEPSAGRREMPDVHSVWLASRRTWVDVLQPLHHELQDFHNVTLTRLSECWTATHTLARSMATIDAESIHHVVDRHVAELDMWAACFMTSFNSAALTRLSGLQSTASVCRFQRQAAGQLRHLVQQLEAEVRSQGQQLHHSLVYLAVLAHAWLPVVLQCTSLLWTQCLRWETKLGAPVTVDPATGRLLSLSELSNVQRDVSDARWDLTNLMRELSFATRTVATQSSFSLPRGGAESLDASALPTVSQTMKAARELSLRLSAMALRFIKNPQQLVLTRKAVEAVTFSMQSAVAGGRHAEESTGVLTTTICSLLLVPSTGAVDTDDAIVGNDFDTKFVQKFQYLLTTCDAHLLASRSQVRVGDENHRIVQLMHALESFAIFSRGREATMPSGSVKEMIDCVSGFLSPCGLNAVGDQDSALEREWEARWYLFRLTRVPSVSVSANLCSDALRDFVPTLVKAEAHVQAHFALQAQPDALNPIPSANPQHRREVPHIVATFCVSPTVPPTDVLPLISDILVASAVRHYAAQSDGSDPVIELLTHLSRWCVQRWDLAVEIIMGCGGVTAAGGTYRHVWRQRVECALTLFTEWPSVVALRLFISIEDMLSQEVNSSELKSAMLLSVAQPPPVDCVQLAHHDVLAVDAGLGLVIESTAPPMALPPVEVGRSESTLVAHSLLRIFASANTASEASVTVLGALTSPSIEVLKGITLQLPHHLYTFCSDCTHASTQLVTALPKEVLVGAKWVLHTRLPLRVLHPNPTVNAVHRKRMRWFVLHSITKPISGSALQDLSFAVALFNTSVAAFVLPDNDHRVLRLPVAAPPLLASPQTDPFGLATRSAAAAVASIPTNARSKDVVMHLYRSLKDAVQEHTTANTTTQNECGTFVSLWLRSCLRLLMDDVALRGRTRGEMPYMFEACSDLHMVDIDLRLAEGIALVRTWCTTIHPLAGHADHSPPTAASQEDNVPMLWSYLLVTTLVTHSLQAAEIPAVERELSALAGTCLPTLIEAARPAHTHVAADAICRASPGFVPLTAETTNVLGQCLSKVRRWCSATMREASAPALSAQAGLAGSLSFTQGAIQKQLHDIAVLSNNPASTPTESSECAHAALDVVENVLATCHPLLRLTEAAPAQKLWNETVSLVCDACSNGSTGSRRPHDRLLAAARRIVEGVLSTQTPPFLARGETLRKLLVLVSIHDRLSLGSIPPVTTVATMRSLVAYTKFLMLDPPHLHSQDGQTILSFVLGAFQLHRDAVAGGTVGWSSKRTDQVDGAYTALLDLLVVFSRAPRPLHLGNPKVLRILNETFGFQTVAILQCIQKCIDTSTSGLPASRLVLDAWMHVRSDGASISAGTHGDSTKLTSAALMYFFSGRWKSAPPASQPKLSAVLPVSSFFENCVDEYLQLLKQEAGRTRGVSAKKRHLLPLDGFAARACRQLLVGQQGAMSLPILINPMQLPSDWHLAKAMRVFTAGGQHEATLTIFSAAHSYMFITGDVLLDVLRSATKSLGAHAQVAQGLGTYSLWLLCTTYQSHELPCAALPWCIEAHAVASTMTRDAMQQALETTLCPLSQDITHVVRRVCQHLSAAAWCRLLNHVSSLPPVIALDMLSRIPVPQRSQLLQRLHTNLASDSEHRNEDDAYADKQRYQLSQLLSTSLGRAVEVQELSALTSIAASWTWRRAAGLLTSMFGRNAITSAGNSLAHTDVLYQLVQVVVRGALRSTDSKDKGGTPSKALWVQGREQLATWMLQHAVQVNASTTTAVTQPKEFDSLRANIHRSLMWLQFLLKSQVRHQWALALPLATGARQLFEQCTDSIRASPGLTSAEQVESLREVTHKAVYASIAYLLDRCDLVSRSPVPAPILSQFLMRTLGRPLGMPHDPMDDSRSKAALRLLARHPRVAWLDVVQIWQASQPQGTAASFPTKLAVQLFDTLKANRQYSTILRVAAALDAGPHRDESLYVILTQAATIVTPRAVDDMMLCLRGQLVAKTVEDIMHEQEHTQRVESVSFLRKAMLGGNWVAALQALLDRPVSLMSPRFTDACNALSSKGKGFTMLPLVQHIIRKDELDESSNNSADDNDGGQGGAEGTNPLALLLATNGPLLDAFLQCYASSHLLTVNAQTMSEFAPAAAWALRARILECNVPEVTSTNPPAVQEDPAHVMVEEDTFLPAVAATVAALPRPDVPLLEGTVVSAGLSAPATQVVIWNLLGELMVACVAIDQLKGRNGTLSTKHHRVKRLMMERPDVALQLARLAVSVRPHAAVVICRTTRSLSQAAATPELLGYLRYSEAYLQVRHKLMSTTTSSSPGQHVVSQRDVALFAPTALHRWAESLALVAASHDHLIVSDAIASKDSSGKTTTSRVTAHALRRMLAVATQSGDPAVVIAMMRSLTARSIVSNEVFTECVGDYLEALQRASTMLAARGNLPAKSRGCDPFPVWTESMRRIEALADISDTTDTTESMQRAAAQLGALSSAVESLVWCLTQPKRLTMFSQALHHGRGQFSSTGLWTLITRALHASTGGELSHNVAARARLGTALLTFAGHLCDASAACDSESGGRLMRSRAEEIEFWRTAIPRLTDQISALVGGDCVIPGITPTASPILSHRQIDAQIHAVLQLVERGLDVGVADPLQYLRSSLQTIVLPAPRAAHIVAANEESFAMVKLLCVRVGGADWQVLMEELLGSWSQQVVIDKATSASSGAVDQTLLEKASQQQLLHIIKVSSSWATALTHASQYVSTTNNRIPAELVAAVVERVCVEVCGPLHVTTTDDSSTSTVDDASGGELLPTLDGRDNLLQAATGLYYHAVSHEVLPTSLMIEHLLHLCTTLHAYEEGVELLQSLTQLPLPPQSEHKFATGDNHVSPPVVLLPYTIRDETQTAVTTFLNSLLISNASADAGGAAIDVRQHIAGFVMWLTRFRDHDILQPAFITALLESLGVVNGAQRFRSSGGDERVFRAVVELLAYTARHPKGNLSLRGVRGETLAAAMAVLGRGCTASSSKTQKLSLSPQVTPGQLAERVLTCCSSLPQLQGRMAAEFAAAKALATSADKGGTPQHHDTLADALQCYRIIMHDSSTMESRALSSAIPTTPMPGMSMWAHAMSLMGSFVAHALPSDDAVGDAGLETSASLLPSLHNACDVLIAEGKWKRALACGHAVAKAHGLAHLDPFVVGSVAAYFGRHHLLDAGRSIVEGTFAEHHNSSAAMRHLMLLALQQRK